MSQRRESRIPPFQSILVKKSGEANVKSYVSNYGWILLLAAAIPAAAQQKESAPSESWTVIRAGSLIDGKSAALRRDQVIIIHGNRIESVGDAAAAKIPPGANVIDL